MLDRTSPDGVHSPTPHLRMLITEDNPRDAKLAAGVLEGAGFAVQYDLTDSLELFRERLEKGNYDVILADFNLRNWTAMDALEALKQSGKDIPLIVVTGSLGDEGAVECIKRGAADFVLKDRPARLPAAVQRALEERRLREGQKRWEEALRESEERFRATFENAGIGMALLDMQGRPFKSNPILQQMLGYSGEELSRMVFTEYTHPDDREVAWRLYRELTAGKLEKYEMEKRFLNKGGEVVWGILTVSLVKDRHGRPMCAVGMVQDITKRKLAEAENSRLAVIVNSSDDAIFSVTREGLIDTWNPGAERMYGYAAEEIKGKHFSILIPEGRRGDLAGNEEWLYSGKGLVHYEDENQRKDGMRLQALLTLSPIKDATGYVTGVAGISRDITERKQAENALRESEERFRQIADTIDEVFWTADPNMTRMLYISPAYERVWGRTTASLYKNPRSFLESIHSDDRQRVLANLQAQMTGQAFDHEYRIVCPDGALRWVWDRGFPVHDEAGQVVRYVGIAVDITERKRVEEEKARLATAIEQSAEGVVITNLDGNIEYVNPAFTRITGYSREEALGQNPRILKSSHQDPAFYQNLWATILKGEIWHGELVNRRKDGKLYTEELNIAPVRNARSEITHFIATKQDVTERKTLEAQLQQAAKMEGIGRLAGGVAHDFNNLLTVINGYSELLLEMLASESKVSVHLKEIKNAGERATSLTRQLLAFSRRQVLAPQVLDLNEVIANLEKMLKRLIGEDVMLHTILDRPLGRVKADPGQVEQVIMNLVVNARDAMPTGGNLTIETSNVELDETYARNHVTVKPGPHVMLAVADTGVGMSPETKARIFEPFFTTKEMGKGTGLGLATVYGIVKQSEGSIWVYSELGQGTVFKVYFPAVGESPAAKVQARPERNSALGSETILVVEDEEGVRSLVRVALGSAGYKVIETGDAERALEICANHEGPIHLLLTDVVMPKMSGPLVAKNVTSLRPEIKVLYMSGYTDDAIVHHGVLGEGVPFIQKPFTPVALRKKIREVLG